MRTDKLKTYSVLINWADNTDMGDYGAVVKARDQRHAERITRARMCWNHWADNREKDETRRESLSFFDDGSGEYFGTMVSCDEGAIWKAADLEKALRALLPLVTWKGMDPAAFNAAMEKANSLIAEIDGIE
jgi:hypothetical protein